MCSPATCSTCGKASYRGCGNHVDQVLAGVPQSERCDCASTTAPQGAASGGGSGWFSWRRS